MNNWKMDLMSRCQNFNTKAANSKDKYAELISEIQVVTDSPSETTKYTGWLDDARKPDDMSLIVKTMSKQIDDTFSIHTGDWFTWEKENDLTGMQGNLLVSSWKQRLRTMSKTEPAEKVYAYYDEIIKNLNDRQYQLDSYSESEKWFGKTSTNDLYDTVE